MMNRCGLLQQLVATVVQVLQLFVSNVDGHSCAQSTPLYTHSQRHHKQCYATLLFRNDRSDLRHMSKNTSVHVKTHFV